MSSGSLRRLLASHGIPVVGIVGDSVPYSVTYADDATEDQRIMGDDLAANFVEPTEPDWSAFRSALRSNPEWKRVLSADLVDAAVLTSTLWQATSNPQLFVEVVELWNSLVSVLSPTITSAEIDTINGLAAASNIPLLLDNDGTMQILM